jgi:hypothetical protein
MLIHLKRLTLKTLKEHPTYEPLRVYVSDPLQSYAVQRMTYPYAPEPYSVWDVTAEAFTRHATLAETKAHIRALDRQRHPQPTPCA